MGGVVSGGILNAGTNTVITNTGSIDAITNSGTLTTLTNSGTLTTLTNTGTLTTLTNTGTLNALDNSGTLTTFNNDGAVSYSGTLPINYNLIINSSSDYGQTTFSTVSGAMAFGIDPSSTVSEDSYVSVLNGLNESNLTSVTFVSHDAHWSLRNSSGSTWDLVRGLPVPSAASTQTTINSISTSMKSQFGSFAMTTNFANLNTYDCGLFDARGGCFSVGGRFTDVNAKNNSDTDSSALVAVGGFKIDDNLRVAGFIDQMVNNNTPDGIKVENQKTDGWDEFGLEPTPEPFRLPI